MFPHTLRGVRGADEQFATQWQRSGFVNAYLGRMALSLADALQLGRRDATDFLGISLTGTDRVGHRFGPDSREYEDVMARVDDVLGDLIDALDATVGRARYVLVLTADHGVPSIPSVAAGTGIVVNEDVRDRIEETLQARYGQAAGGSHVEWSVWGGYLLRPATAMRLATVRAVQTAAQSVPGVERLLYTPTLPRDSKDSTLRMAELSGGGTRRGEFLLVVAKGWVYNTRNGAEAVHHNTGRDVNQRVPLIFFGGDVRAVVTDSPVSPIDIAPTLASLAGITMPSAEGRVLRDVVPIAPSGTSSR